MQSKAHDSRFGNVIVTPKLEVRGTPKLELYWNRTAPVIRPAAGQIRLDLNGQPGMDQNKECTSTFMRKKNIQERLTYHGYETSYADKVTAFRFTGSSFPHVSEQALPSHQHNSPIETAPKKQKLGTIDNPKNHACEQDGDNTPVEMHEEAPMTAISDQDTTRNSNPPKTDPASADCADRNSVASLCNEGTSSPVDTSATPSERRVRAGAPSHATPPPVTRGARGQLSYDTQQMDERAAKRLLDNRSSARRARERRLEHVRQAEEALRRCAAENAALRVHLGAALRLIAEMSQPSPSPPPPQQQLQQPPPPPPQQQQQQQQQQQPHPQQQQTHQPPQQHPHQHEQPPPQGIPAHFPLDWQPLRPGGAPAWTRGGPT